MNEEYNEVIKRWEVIEAIETNQGDSILVNNQNALKNNPITVKESLARAIVLVEILKHESSVLEEERNMYQDHLLMLSEHSVQEIATQERKATKKDVRTRIDSVLDL